jgi:hypothetical protein
MGFIEKNVKKNKKEEEEEEEALFLFTLCFNIFQFMVCCNPTAW